MLPFQGLYISWFWLKFVLWNIKFYFTLASPNTTSLANFKHNIPIDWHTSDNNMVTEPLERFVLSYIHHGFIVLDENTDAASAVKQMHGKNNKFKRNQAQ